MCYPNLGSCPPYPLTANCVHCSSSRPTPSEQITNCDIVCRLYGSQGRPVDVIGTNCAHWAAY